MISMTNIKAGWVIHLNITLCNLTEIIGDSIWLRLFSSEDIRWIGGVGRDVDIGTDGINGKVWYVCFITTGNCCLIIY